MSLEDVFKKLQAAKMAGAYAHWIPVLQAAAQRSYALCERSVKALEKIASALEELVVQGDRDR